MAEDERDENFLITQRREKLKALREAGRAYGNRFRRNALTEDVRGHYDARSAESLESEEAVFTLAGRMMAKRVMGKASFIQLQDDTGRLQVFVQRDGVGETAYADFKTWDVGDQVGVEGRVFRTKTGELSLRAHRVELLAKSLRPLPEKWAGLTDTETKYRQRYLDLVINPEARARFERRSEIVRFIRHFLDSLGFLEVETPMLQPIPGGAAARPFSTHYNALDRDFYLRIAPELYLKRLVVGGMERVYELNRNFRNEGLSTRHNPEFTMLEFYQAHADYSDGMALIENLIRDLALSICGTGQLVYQGQDCDLASPFVRETLADAVARHNPDLDSSRFRDREYLATAARTAGIDVDAGHGAGKLLTELFEKTVESKLDDPTFITAYPTEVSPLARRNDDDPDLTDRFELFIGGREIANGFSELNDPDDQAARFRAQAAAHERGDDEAMVFDADYVRALEFGMPPATGVGLGIDRLVMLLTDSPSIRDVLLFPQMRQEA